MQFHTFALSYPLCLHNESEILLEPYHLSKTFHILLSNILKHIFLPLAVFLYTNRAYWQLIFQ